MSAPGAALGPLLLSVPLIQAVPIPRHKGRPGRARAPPRWTGTLAFSAREVSHPSLPPRHCGPASSEPLLPRDAQVRDTRPLASAIASGPAGAPSSLSCSTRPRPALRRAGGPVSEESVASGRRTEEGETTPQAFPPQAQGHPKDS